MLCKLMPGASEERTCELAGAIVEIGTDRRGRRSLQRIGEDVTTTFSFSSHKILERGTGGELLLRSSPPRSLVLYC